MLTTIIILTLIWVGWGAAAVLSAISVRKFARRYERPSREQFENFRPPAAVIVPFKGLDLDFNRAIEGLANQDYREYELLCVVESEDDPAYPALKNELAKYPHRASRVLVAGVANKNEGQKVHNLLHAIEELLQSDGQEEIWAFADSDAIPGPQWLGAIVGPHCQPNLTAVTTGYRWMTPAENSKSIWNHIASVINSSVACFYGYDKFNHAWGGSMAVLRSTAIEANLQNYLRGALSDDYQMTQMSRDLDRRVYFVPRCLVASPVEFDAHGFFEFARRQYIITRTHAPTLYRQALALLLLHLVGWISVWGTLISIFWTGLDWWHLLPIAAILTVFISNQCRASYRKRALLNAFDHSVTKRLQLALRIDRWLTPVWMTLHFMLMASALFTRTINWRGKRYRIDGPQNVTQL